MLENNTTNMRGITLIELLIVMAIALVLAVISVTGWNSFYANSGTDVSARKVLAILEEAHARTLSADNGAQYGVHFTSGTVTLFQGDTYNALDPDNDVYTLNRATISDISLAGGASGVVFSRLRGSASATGTVTVTQNVDATLFRTITINATGLSEISP